MQTDYDVVIVGARVAGAMTALHLARAGHTVLIVDRAGPPTDTLSTHSLMRTAVVQLHRAGLLTELAAQPTPAIRRMTLGFGEQVFSFDVRSEFGVDALYAPRRTVLDPLVLSAASRAGADVALGRAVTQIDRDESGRVSGVTIGRGSDAVRVSSRYVVGADGRNSTVARLVGASDRHRSAPTAASVYSYYSGMPDTGFDFRFAPGATAGTLRTNDDLTLVWAGLPAERFTEPGEVFSSVLLAAAPDIAEAAADAERVERLHFTSGITPFLRSAAGPGWVLVGDAGFTKDPLSAHGISCAFRDAEFAADALNTGLSTPGSERQAFRTYEARRDRFAVPLAHETAALASYAWTLEDASNLMRSLGRLTDAECEYLTGARTPEANVA